jgi:glycosyltransferase involved in cell wall biosynthesis
LSKRVIVFTEYTYQHLLRIGVQEARLRILPHVAYAENFNEQAEDNEVGTLLRESGITGSPLLLGVGQLIQRKGWEYTVRCLPAIIARYPDAKLLIVGPSQPAEPSFRQHLLKLANELGVQNHLYIMQDNPPAFIRDAYRSATLLTHPSFVESFGMVLLEAMMVGLPVVAHNGTGIPCIVDDGVTGFVLDVRDVNSYAAKLLAILDHPEQREKMGLAGKELARTRFSQQEISDQLFALYNEVVGNKSSPMLPSTSTQKQIEPTYSGKGTTE